MKTSRQQHFTLRLSYAEMEMLLPLLHQSTAELAFEGGCEDPRFDPSQELRALISAMLDDADKKVAA